MNKITAINGYIEFKDTNLEIIKGVRNIAKDSMLSGKKETIKYEDITAVELGEAGVIFGEKGYIRLVLKGVESIKVPKYFVTAIKVPNVFIFEKGESEEFEQFKIILEQKIG
ncbi:MAG: hypothetical protein OHK0017_08470 [Patescibacteria group bacterium]